MPASYTSSTRGASYFDLAVARLAGVLAAGRAGDDAASRRWLEQLGTLASSVGDVVFVAIAQLLSDRPAVPADPGDSGSVAPGWRRIVDSVVVG